jgi:hypothetical protein
VPFPILGKRNSLTLSLCQNKRRARLLSRPSTYTHGGVTKPQLFTADKESWTKDYRSILEHERTLTVQSLASAEILTDGPIRTIKFDAGSRNLVTIYHGVTLRRYKQMLRLCAWDRSLSIPPGDFSMTSALYFSNDWVYGFMWSNLKRSGYKSMRLSRGVVISVTLDLSQLPVTSHITDGALESTIKSHMNNVPVQGLHAVVAGGFLGDHIREFRGNTADVLEGGGRGHLLASEGCPEVTVEGLLQVAFLTQWGEDFLGKQTIKVFALDLSTTSRLANVVPGGSCRLLDW